MARKRKNLHIHIMMEKELAFQSYKTPAMQSETPGCIGHREGKEPETGRISRDHPSMISTRDHPSMMSPGDHPTIISPGDRPSMISPGDHPSMISPRDHPGDCGYGESRRSGIEHGIESRMLKLHCSRG